MSARFLLALLLLAGENAISLTAELKVVNDPATRTVLSNVDVAATNSHGSTYHKRSAYPSAADAQPVPMFVEHDGSAFSPVQSLIQPPVAASSQVVASSPIVASSPVVASNPVVTAGASYQPRQPLAAIHDGTGAYGGGGPLASSIGAIASSSYQSHQPYSDPTLLQQPVNPISSGYGNTPSLIQNPGIISSGYQAHQPVVGDVLNRDQYLTLESRYKHALRPETAGYLDRQSYNRPADLLVASQDPLGYGSSSRHDVAVSLVPGGTYGNQQQQLARPDLTNRILSQRSANYGGSYEQLQRLLGRYIARRDYSGARTPVVDSLGGNSFLDQTRSTFGPGFINGVGGGGGFPLGQFRNQGNFVLGQGGLRI